MFDNHTNFKLGTSLSYEYRTQNIQTRSNVEIPKIQKIQRKLESQNGATGSLTRGLLLQRPHCKWLGYRGPRSLLINTICIVVCSQKPRTYLSTRSEGRFYFVYLF